MTFLLRRASVALLVMSVLVLTGAAQDEQVRVVGSAVAGQAFTEVAAADAFLTEFGGTQNGLGVFCGNSADIVLTNRPISQAEESACTANGVNFIELLVGFDGYAFIASPDVDFADCLSTANLDAIIAPSLTGTDVDWSAVSGDYPATAIQFVHAGVGSRPGALLDRVVRGDGFRGDATVVADSAAVLAEVAAGEGMLGLVSLTDAIEADGVNVIGLSNPTLNTCVEPSAETAFSRQYQGGDRLFAYVNSESLSKPGVADALAALTQNAAVDVLTAADFVPPTESLREQAAAVATSGTAGRSFSRDVNTFQVTGDTTGTLRVGGDAAGANYLKAALATVPQRYPTITLEEAYLGGPAAVREFCNGNRELIALGRELTAEEQAACDANGITAHEIALGAKAAILIANAESEYLSCVSTELIARVFTAGEAPVATWNEFDGEYGEDPVYLFVPSKGDAAVDLMLGAATGSTIPVRDDVQVNEDAAYRAAAVANTRGSVAVMSWADAQDALSVQDGLQLVAVQDEGGDCIEPTLSTIADGTYPLSQPVRLLVNAAALETDMVQATLITLFADENFSQIEGAGLTGVAFADLVDIRSDLVTAFRAADEAQAEREAAELEATPEVTDPGGEATPEPEADDAGEPTSEADATAAP